MVTEAQSTGVSHEDHQSPARPGPAAGPGRRYCIRLPFRKPASRSRADFGGIPPGSTHPGTRIASGFELQLLESLLRSGLISIDPFGLFRLKSNSDVAQIAQAIVVQRILEAVNDPAKLKVFQQAGWKDKADISKDFRFNTDPDMTFVDSIWPDYGNTDTSAIVTIADKLNDVKDCGITEEELANVLADTVIHEMTHWKQKQKTTKGADPAMQGGIFLDTVWGGQYLIEGLGPSGAAGAVSTPTIKKVVIGNNR